MFYDLHALHIVTLYGIERWILNDLSNGELRVKLNAD